MDPFGRKKDVGHKWPICDSHLSFAPIAQLITPLTILLSAPFGSVAGTRPRKAVFPQFHHSLDVHLSEHRGLPLLLAWAPRVIELGSSSQSLNLAQNAAGKPLNP